MRISLKFSNDATEFINYLVSFKKISDTLLLEVDVENSRFAAKSTFGVQSTDSTKCAYFPFEKCGITVTGSTEECKHHHVYIGFLNRLGKLISIVMEANRRVQKYQGVGFSLIVDYAEMQIADVDDKRQLVNGCISMMVKTDMLPNKKSLSMSLGGYNLTKGAIALITDQIFDERIYYLDPTSKFSFEVDQESLESIFRIMEVYKTNGRKDNEIVINIQKNYISISNETITNQQVSPAFNEIIYSGEIAPNYVGESIRIGKDAFKRSISKKDNLVISVGMSCDNELDRLCVETVASDSSVSSRVVFCRIFSED